jgi:biopolymer transport protein ExbD
MQVGSNKGGPMADINVTPFIDVCLVLLIIFMVVVVVTMVQLGYLSKMPPPNPGDSIPDPRQIVIRVSGCGTQGNLGGCKIFINREEVQVNELKTKCAQLAVGRKNELIFFTAEDGANYENVIKVIDIIHDGGLQNMAILTQQISTDSLLP